MSRVQRADAAGASVPAHDAASRRLAVVDRHVAWIHERVPERPHPFWTGCGPGLYARPGAARAHLYRHRLFPASIAYAEDEARRANLACTYRLADIGQADYGSATARRCSLRRDERLRPGTSGDSQRMHDSLVPGGVVILEVSTYAAIRQQGLAGPLVLGLRGLFSEQPYLYLQGSHWDEATAASALRYYVVDTATAEVTLTPRRCRPIRRRRCRPPRGAWIR